jgi:hypothetical protein
MQMISITWAVFQSSGTVPLSSDVWKIKVSDGVIDFVIFLKKRVDSWSGPVALCGFFFPTLSIIASFSCHNPNF